MLIIATIADRTASSKPFSSSFLAPPSHASSEELIIITIYKRTTIYKTIQREVSYSSSSSHFRLCTVSSSAEFVLRSLDSRRILHVSHLTILYFRYTFPYPYLHRLRSLYPRIQPVEVSPWCLSLTRRRLRGGDFGARASNRLNHRRACERACAREHLSPSSTHHRRPTDCKRRMAIMDTATWEVDGVGTVVVALSALLFVLLFVLAAVLGCRRPTTGLVGPTAYPIIGTLHAMDGHRDNPFRRFTELARLYGPVYAMTMGSIPCVIVNDYPSIKEVLITNGSKFGGRPNFSRYNVLFAGDRNNCEYIV